MSKTEQIKLFTKAQISSLIASGVDFALTALLFQFCSVHYSISTFCGAVAGAMTNCFVNCQWTYNYKVKNLNALILRYSLAWSVSILLNVGLTSMTVFIIENYYETKLASFLFVKMLVAISVAVFWNYPIQKNYVYKKKQIL